MKTGKVFKFFIVFFLFLILLSIVGTVFNLIGGIIGTLFGILGLLFNLVFSKSFLTLAFVGWIAYMIVNRSEKKQRYPQYMEREY